MFVLRQYTGFVLLAFVPLTALFAACTTGYLLAISGKKLTSMVVALALRKQEPIIDGTTTKLTDIQPRVIASGLEA
jgi:ABC-type proline/glycine betaine transport system permease subunit